MTKDDLMSHWDEIVTDRRLTLASVNEHLATVAREGPSLLLDRYLVVSTSGTSGRSAIVAWDADEFVDALVANSRVSVWEQQMGIHGARVTSVMIAADSPVHVSAASAWLLDQPGRLQLSARLPIGEIIVHLNALDRYALIVYSSIARRLADAASAGELRVLPLRVATLGEPLYDEDRRAITAAFGVIPQEGYSATEGLIAHGDPINGGLRLVEDVGVFEPVNRDFEPVEPAKPGDFLLLTNLGQTTLPLIRYALDDCVMIDPTPGPPPYTGRRLASVEGRSDDWFRYRGGLDVHPHLFRSVLVRHPSITEYQVHQTATGAEVTVVGLEPTSAATVQAEFTQSLADAGVERPHVVVRVVPDLGRSTAAKLRRFIPLGQSSS